jgi:putative toxin-antitoxin system antitoxin component (TIGR02293 family)
MSGFFFAAAHRGMVCSPLRERNAHPRGSKGSRVIGSVLEMRHLAVILWPFGGTVDRGVGEPPSNQDGSLMREDRDESGSRLLGVRVRTAVELVAHVQRGFSYAAFERLQRALGMPAQELAECVQIPTRTLLRRRESGRLLPEESDRLLRVARVFQQAVELFEGDEGRARQWLNSPKRALGDHTPLDWMRTEAGAREVENLIGRLEHGVFS